MRKNEGLAGRLDKVPKRVLDREDEGVVLARKGAEVGRPFGQRAVDRLLNAERVGQAGVALAHHALRVALELDGLARGGIGRAGATGRAGLEVPTCAALGYDRSTWLRLGALGRCVARRCARMLANPLGLVARLDTRVALARMARLFAPVVPATEELAAYLATRHALLSLRATHILDGWVLAARARLGGEERARWALGRLVTVVGRLGVAARRVGTGTREDAGDSRAASDWGVDNRVAAVANELLVGCLETASAGTLVVGTRAGVDAAAEKLAASERAGVEVVVVNVDIEDTAAALALGLVRQRAADARALVVTAIAQCLADTLAEELGLAERLAFAHIVAVEQ